MSVYGYCRISTPQQNIERQVRNIAATYPAAHIVREVYTGTACRGRQELDKLLHCVQPGDTIVFDSVSRMSRSAEEGCALYEELYRRGVNLCFLKEPHINTDTYKQALQRQINSSPETGSAATDRFVSGIMDALNRYTSDLAKEQIRLAFTQAQKGQMPGRKLTIKKSAPCKEQIKKYSRDFDGTLTDADCIKLIGIARNTYYKYKRELREELTRNMES